MSRTIPMKPYKVTAPDGKVHLVYAQTEAGAIRDVSRHLKSEFTAEHASGEDLYIAARENLPILNAPASIARTPDQVDASGED